MSITKISKDLIAINSNQMDNNSYILINGTNAIIIDPSFSGSEILSAINGKYKVLAILLTHAHFDHCYDVAKLEETFKCPVYIHTKDKITYEKYDYAQLVSMTLPRFDKYVKYFNSKELTIGDFKLEVILTPGHTSGSVTYIWNNYVFVGDTLFFDSCGRTDLVNSSSTDIVKSLRTLFDTIKPECLVLPGHSRWAEMKQIKAVNYTVASMLDEE